MKEQLIGKLGRLEHLLHRYYGHGHHGGGGPFRGQGRILSLLKIKSEISQKELAYVLDMRKQSLAELLTKLEQKGYITREPSQDDRRVMIIKLTESGEEAADSLEEGAREQKDIFSILKDEEKDIFLRCIDQLITALESEVGPEPKHPHPHHHDRPGHGCGHGKHHHHGFPMNENPDDGSGNEPE